jgi:hypothetical protein
MMRPVLLAISITTMSSGAAAETVRLPSFSSIEIHAGGEVFVRQGAVQRVNILRGNRSVSEVRVDERGRLLIRGCRIRCSNYQLRVEVVTPHINSVSIRGGGMVAASGPFKPQPSLALSVHGGGLIDVAALPSRHVAAAVYGGGVIRTNPLDHLAANISGGGVINYRGRPSVARSIHGGGLIEPGED